jgi:hypothetical protein
MIDIRASIRGSSRLCQVAAWKDGHKRSCKVLESSARLEQHVLELLEVAASHLLGLADLADLSQLAAPAIVRAALT